MAPTRGGGRTRGLCFSPAAEQNKEPILEVLRVELPRRGLVLEIASGSGQHVVYFARHLARLHWQPTENDPALLESITERLARAALANASPPLRLDVFCRPWPALRAQALLCVNLLHVAPEDTATALFSGAARVLDPGAVVVLYGPFRRNGRHTAASNARFDAGLRLQNAAWGVRDLEAVSATAAVHGFHLHAAVPMPANNLSAVFRAASVEQGRSVEL